MPDRTRARELAAEHLANGDPTGWFERLYREAEEGKSVVPWADRGPSPGLIARPGHHQTALTIGCGLGDDAEQLAAWGFQTTAFDVSPSAIRACQQRFPASPVEYVVADLLSPPPEWSRRFDFVFECNTLQALPPSVRAQAIPRVADFVREGGTLLLIARAREESDPEGDMPWPLTRRELDQVDLDVMSFEDYMDAETPPARRFRIIYRRQ